MTTRWCANLTVVLFLMYSGELDSRNVLYQSDRLSTPVSMYFFIIIIMSIYASAICSTKKKTWVSWSRLAQILIPNGCWSFCKKIVYSACAHCRWACSSRISVRALPLCFCGDYAELLTAIQGGVVESCNVDGKRGLRCRSLREWLAGFWFFGTPVTTRELVHVQVGQCYFQRTNSP